MQFIRLHHVSVHMPDGPAASVAFYWGVRRPAVAHGEVHLSAHYRSTDPTPVRTRVGVAELDAAETELAAAGLGLFPVGSLVVRPLWLRNPAGDTIELEAVSCPP